MLPTLNLKVCDTGADGGAEDDAKFKVEESDLRQGGWTVFLHTYEDQRGKQDDKDNKDKFQKMIMDHLQGGFNGAAYIRNNVPVTMPLRVTGQDPPYRTSGFDNLAEQIDRFQIDWAEKCGLLSTSDTPLLIPPLYVVLPYDNLSTDSKDGLFWNRWVEQGVDRHGEAANRNGTDPRARQIPDWQCLTDLYTGHSLQKLDRLARDDTSDTDWKNNRHASNLEHIIPQRVLNDIVQAAGLSANSVLAQMIRRISSDALLWTLAKADLNNARNVLPLAVWNVVPTHVELNAINVQYTDLTQGVNHLVTLPDVMSPPGTRSYYGLISQDVWPVLPAKRPLVAAAQIYAALTYRGISKLVGTRNLLHSDMDNVAEKHTNGDPGYPADQLTSIWYAVYQRELKELAEKKKDKARTSLPRKDYNTVINKAMAWAKRNYKRLSLTDSLLKEITPPDAQRVNDLGNFHGQWVVSAIFSNIDYRCRACGELLYWGIKGEFCQAEKDLMENIRDYTRGQIVTHDMVVASNPDRMQGVPGDLKDRYPHGWKNPLYSMASDARKEYLIGNANRRHVITTLMIECFAWPRDHVFPDGNIAKVVAAYEAMASDTGNPLSTYREPLSGDTAQLEQFNARKAQLEAQIATVEEDLKEAQENFNAAMKELETCQQELEKAQVAATTATEFETKLKETQNELAAAKKTVQTSTNRLKYSMEQNRKLRQDLQTLRQRPQQQQQQRGGRG